MNYLLRIDSINSEHVHASVFDIKRANCGKLTLQREQLKWFLQRAWQGDLVWNGNLTNEIAEEMASKSI